MKKELLLILIITCFLSCGERKEITEYRKKTEALTDTIIKQGMLDKNLRASFIAQENRKIDSLVKLYGESAFCDTLKKMEENDKIKTAEYEKWLKHFNDSLNEKLASMKSIRIVVTPEKEKKLSTLKKEVDEFKHRTFYHGKEPYGYSSYISLYLGKDSTLYARFKIEYSADDWLFIDNYQFLCDGKTYDFRPETDIQRDNSGGQIYEWCDVSFNKNVSEIVKAIVNSKETKIRYNGDKYYKDRTITEKEKQNLKFMYEIMTN